MCIWRLVPLTSDQVDSTQLHALASVPLAQDSARRLIKLANLPQAFLPVVARLRKQGAQAERKKEKTPKGECLGSTEHPGLLTPEGVMLESMKPHLNKEIKVDHDCGVGVE